MNHEAEGVSRRSFVELACGTLVALPTLAGGLVLAPRPAYGAEDGNGDQELAGLESEYVVIDIVNPYEVGFIVVDATKGKANKAGMVSYPPVEGAKVTVKSRFNGKTAQGKSTTDKYGVVNIDGKRRAFGRRGRLCAGAWQDERV